MRLENFMATKEDRELVLSMLEEGRLTLQDMYGLSKEAKKIHTQEDYPSKKYLHYEDAYNAYTHILDTGASPQEALAYVIEYFVHPDCTLEEYIDKIKNNTVWGIKNIVKEHDDHPKQKQMIKNGTLDRKSINKCRTPNEQLGNLHRSVQLDNKLQSLEEDNIQLKQDIKTLEASDTVKTSEIEELYKVNNLELMSPKDKASLLKSKGFNRSEISKYIGVSYATIKRWWKEI